MNLISIYPELKNIAPLRTEERKNTASNNIMELNKEITYQPIFQFTTSNETDRIRHFDLPLREGSAGHS